MTSYWSFNLFKILKFGFKIFNVTFNCHIRVKDLYLLKLFEKNHHDFKIQT